MACDRMVAPGTVVVEKPRSSNRAATGPRSKPSRKRSTHTGAPSPPMFASQSRSRLSQPQVS